MKNHRYCLEFFAFYDHTAIQRRVEEMAAQGWLLEKPGNFLWTYRRTEPRRLHAAVTYFPTASPFDPGPSQGELTMEEFCAQDGWRLLARWGQMQIFVSQEEDPVPIDTDPMTQVETVHRSMKRAMLPGHLVLAAVILGQLWFHLLQFRQDPVGFLASTSSLLGVPMWLLLLLATLYEIFFYFWWHRKAVQGAEDGFFLPVRTNRLASALLLGGAIFLLLFSAIGSRSRLGILLGGVCPLWRHHPPHRPGPGNDEAPRRSQNGHHGGNDRIGCDFCLPFCVGDGGGYHPGEFVAGAPPGGDL